MEEEAGVAIEVEVGAAIEVGEEEVRPIIVLRERCCGSMQVFYHSHHAVSVICGIVHTVSVPRVRCRALVGGSSIPPPPQTPQP